MHFSVQKFAYGFNIGDNIELRAARAGFNVGDFVEQGTVIAESGATGTYDPHLHFVVWANDDSIQKASIPVVFRNTSKSHPSALKPNENYTAQSFSANQQ